MFKKVVIVGALSLFGYAVFKRVYLTEMEEVDSGSNSDSNRSSYETDNDD